MSIRITFETVDVEGAESLTPIKILTYDSKGSGITAAGKQALIDLLEKVAYIDQNGQAYLDALEAALFPPASLVSISAVYAQTSSVFAGDDLDDLKDDLVVTAHYDDGSSEALTTYTLSGELEENPSVITVSYGGKTTTFSVALTELSSISAVYTQTGTVYSTDPLTVLMSDLVVTAVYTDQSTEVVTDYTLSGTLAVGTSTITVSYGGKTDTISVTVTLKHVPYGYTEYDYVKYIGAEESGTTAAVNYIITTATYSNLNALKIDFYMLPHVAQTGSTAGILGGDTATSGNTKVVGFYGRTDTKRISCFSHGTAIGIDSIPEMEIGNIIHVVLDPGTASPSSLTVGSLSATGAWSNQNTINAPLGYFGKLYSGHATLKPFVSIGVLKLYNVSDNSLVGEYYPCVREEDNRIGIWDMVSEAFYTTAYVSTSTIGNQYCRYAVGYWEGE